jgi:C_GCAxxG_C_C family probable redox protein
MPIRRFVMNNVERTADLLSTGLNCSQAILTVFGESYGLHVEMAAKLGRPLGGGMGHMAKTCGAVISAVLILGMAKDRQDEGEARKVSHSCVQDLFRRFADLHGTTECKELLGADMSTEEGLKKVQEEKLVRKVCPLFVRDTAIILEGLLNP